MVGDVLERFGCLVGLPEGEVTSLEPVVVVVYLVGLIPLMGVKEVVQAAVVLGDVEEAEASIEAKARVLHVVGVEASPAR